MIDITGLDKASVIQALYAAARPQGMGFLHYTPGDLPRDEAEALVGKHIDYLHGRVMKLTIKADSDSFQEGTYDRDNGLGAAATVIRGLREGSAHAAALIHAVGVETAAADALEDMQHDSGMTAPGEFTLRLPSDPRLVEAIDKARRGGGAT